MTEISAYAFYNCSGLTSVTIPNAVTKIDTNAFYGCSGLKEVTLPISAEYRVDGKLFNYKSLDSFAGCGNVQKITYTVGNGTVFAHGQKYTLPGYARSALTTVVYEEGIPEIPEYALNNCSKVTTVTLPSTVTKIGNYAFYSCTSLPSIAVPECTKSIGDFAFYGCSSLESTGSLKNVESIGRYAFYNCSGLKEIDISGLTEISGYIFYNCSGLTSVTIPNVVKTIGDAAFYGCSGLQEVTLPISAGYRVDGRMFDYKSLDSFAGCENVQKVTYTVGDGSVFNPTSTTTSGSADTLPYYAYKTLTTVVYEEGISEVPDRALYRYNYSYEKLTSVTLPSTVKKIGTCAFNGCSDLADVYYLDRESQWENVKANTATGNTPLLNARIHFVQDGDINGSFGAPDVNDVQCLYTYLASGDILGAYKNNAEMFTSLADVNMDSTVDVYDLQLLYETVSGIV